MTTMTDTQIKDDLKRMSLGLEPIIDLLGGHAEGVVVLSADDAAKCEKTLREMESKLNDIVFALATR